MKRKTNLFYSTGNDSNFVTFSNYTEALTGNILATDAKMFPSKFICVYIPTLAGLRKEDDNFVDIEDFDYITEKQHFITNYLSGYYENKLATLRDFALENGEKVEKNIDPLDYLLQTIVKYDENAQFTFVDEICEQEYNGTFMDNICIIENNASANIYKYSLIGFDENSQVNIETHNYFHGWENANMPESYQETKPIYDFEDDETHIYYKYSESTFEKIEKTDVIKFNILIPLFDIAMINLNNDGVNSSNYESEKQNIEDILVLDAHSYENQFDIPIGMWFSDKTIVLERSDEISGTTYRPSWSLCISSQFKPFPYGTQMPNEIEEYENLDKFATFAMIMSKQAYIQNEFGLLNESIASLRDRIITLENASKVS